MGICQALYSDIDMNERRLVAFGGKVMSKADRPTLPWLEKGDIIIITRYMRWNDQSRSLNGIIFSGDWE
jgi:hypothetical protein